MAEDDKKTKTQQEKEAEEAAQQLNQILDQSRPKNAIQGTASGVNNILAGAVGGAGVAILAPTVGLAAGTRQAGLLGGVAGLTVGAVGGVVVGTGLVVGGE